MRSEKTSTEERRGARSMIQSTAAARRVGPSAFAPSSASTSGPRWLAEARGGIATFTSSPTRTRPAASCCRKSRYASEAASALATSSFESASGLPR